MFTVFGAYRNSDMTEGKGTMVLDELFSLATDAEAYILGKEGVFGRRPQNFGHKDWSTLGDWEVRPLVVLTSLDEVVEHRENQVRRRALDKLTPEERKALGIE